MPQTLCKAAISIRRLYFVCVGVCVFYLDHSVTTSLYTSLPKFKGGINYGYTRTADELPVGTVREASRGKKEPEFSLHFTAETVALSDRFICQVLWVDVYANASPPVG